MDSITIHHLGKTIPMHLYDKGEVVSDEIRRLKTFYELDLLEYIRKNFPVCKTIIDIGANIGNHSLYFHEFIEHEEIYCFEPVHSNFNLLALNLKRPNSKCRLFEIALSDRHGDAPLYNSQPGNNGGFSLEKYAHSYSAGQSVKTYTLDGSLHLEDITLMKIDVEAHELQVLNGARQTILRNKPAIFVEDLHHGYPDQFPANRFDEFFKEVNYKKVIKIGLMELWVAIV